MYNLPQGTADALQSCEVSAVFGYGTSINYSSWRISNLKHMKEFTKTLYKTGRVYKMQLPICCKDFLHCHNMCVLKQHTENG